MLYELTKNMSKSQAITVIMGGALALTTVTFGFQRYTGKDMGGNVPGSPRTTSDEWNAASVEYAKMQKANPIRHFK